MTTASNRTESLNKDFQKWFFNEIKPLQSRQTRMTQFVVFKLLRYCFEEAIGFDVKASFAKSPVPRLIKQGDITKEI